MNPSSESLPYRRELHICANIKVSAQFQVNKSNFSVNERNRVWWVFLNHKSLYARLGWQGVSMRINGRWFHQTILMDGKAHSRCSPLALIRMERRAAAVHVQFSFFFFTYSVGWLFNSYLCDKLTSICIARTTNYITVWWARNTCVLIDYTKKNGVTKITY